MVDNDKNVDEYRIGKKVIRAVHGKKPRIKTVAIVSTKNPMGFSENADDNQNFSNQLIRHLHIGHYPYFKVTANNKDSVNSIMVYNITWEDTIKLVNQYSQKLGVFIDMTIPSKVRCMYWEDIGYRSSFKLHNVKNEVIEVENATNLYTAVCNSLKFRMPSFESVFMENILDIYERLDIKEKELGSDRIYRLLKESLDCKYTGKHQYYCRGHLYGK